MCDYSLEHLALRPARVGDKLVTTCFHRSLTIGFCAVGAPNVAVCLQPGTELAFEREHFSGELESSGPAWRASVASTKGAGRCITMPSSCRAERLCS